MWQTKKVSILLLLAIFFISCSGEEPLQNPQTAENVENQVEDIENQKVKVAVRIGSQKSLYTDVRDRFGVSELHNLVTYNSIAINLLELPDIEFIRDNTINGIWDYMIEFRISFLDDNGNNAIYWVILQNADSSEGKARTVIYPDINWARTDNYGLRSVGDAVVGQKQIASGVTFEDLLRNREEKAKVALRINSNEHIADIENPNNKQIYDSIAKSLVVLPNVEFESDDSIDGVWNYMIEFGMFNFHDRHNAVYWAILQNSDSSDDESRVVYYPNINFKLLQFDQVQNVSREIVEQFRSNYLGAR